MQMKSLEAELQVSLFDRSFRPPKLTPMGRLVADKADQLLETEDALIDLCRPDHHLTGRFRIGFTATTSVRLLPRLLQNAQNQAPGATFEFETGLSDRLETKVTNGLLDAAIITASGDPAPDLIYSTLETDHLIFAIHHDHEGRSLDYLIENIRFLHFMPNTGIGRLIAGEMSRISQQHAPRPIVLDSVEAIMECVKQGIGFTLLPKGDATRYADSRVCLFASSRVSLKRHLVLVTPQGRYSETQSDLLKRLLGE